MVIVLRCVSDWRCISRFLPHRTRKGKQEDTCTTATDKRQKLTSTSQIIPGSADDLNYTGPWPPKQSSLILPKDYSIGLTPKQIMLLVRQNMSYLPPPPPDGVMKLQSDFPGFLGSDRWVLSRRKRVLQNFPSWSKCWIVTQNLRNITCIMHLPHHHWIRCQFFNIQSTNTRIIRTSSIWTTINISWLHCAHQI